MTEVFTDAIALLKADHRKVEELFERFEKATAPAQKKSLVHEICTELKIHTIIEDKIFYPGFRGKIEAASPNDDFFGLRSRCSPRKSSIMSTRKRGASEGTFAQCRKTDFDFVVMRDQVIAPQEDFLARAKPAGLPPAKPTEVNLLAA